LRILVFHGNIARRSNTKHKTLKLPMPDLDRPNAAILFKNGDCQTLQELHSSYYPALCHFAGSLLGETSPAEGIVDEIFSLLRKKPEDFETLSELKAFLYISTRNACMNHLRTLQGGVPNEGTKEEVLRQVCSAIESLPYQCRQIFKLCYEEGLSNSEIAERFRLSAHTVNSHKVRAIGLLRLKFLQGCP
jgi:RNA polymerase sigma factor (sigma-70 family)